MSYLVLARKWRPRSFDTLIGQDHVVRALTNALSSGRLHHAWLFTGTRGVGKTTLSRILAKALNCADGVTATPCGHCQACTEIDAGRYVDYIELDAASNRGVDEMTQLLEQAVYAPSVGRYKVYMIDEVHMLTGHAFNAMLKTLEEPPEHVKFILATTDPQKIPVTVLSRCLQFNLKQMTVPAIVDHLQYVLGQESIATEVPALRLIAQAASGSMRDALSLTDQAIAYSAGKITAAAVGEMLGTLDPHHLQNLLRALAAGDAPAVLAVADELLARGLSFQAALADLAVLLSRVAIAQRLGSAQEEDPDAADVQALAQALSADEVQLFYTVAVYSRRELALAPDEYAGFVMACLRMLALLPADRVPSIMAAPDGGPVAASSSTAKASPSPAHGHAVRAGDAQEPPAPVRPARPSALSPAVAEAPAAEAAPASPESEPEPAVAEAPAAEATAPVPAAELARKADEAPVKESRPSDESALEDPRPAAPDDWTDAARDFVADAPFSDPEFRDETLQDTDPGALDPAAHEEPAADWAPAAALAGLEGAQNAPDVREAPADVTAARWPALAASLPLTGTARALAMNSEWLGVEGARLRLRVAIHSLSAGAGRNRLQTVLSEYFGRVLQLVVETGDTGDGTAYALDQAERSRRQAAAEAAAQADTIVQALGHQFAARVVPGSVRPPAL